MASGQQFNLRWNNHTNNILQVFTEQYNTESLVDVTLSCEGQFLKVHKMVLSACSPYFQDMFRHHLHQVPNAVVIMNGMKFADIKLVIEFMYKGEIKVLETELNGLLAAAEALQVKGLSNVRNKYEKGDIDTTAKATVTPSDSACIQPENTTPIHLRRKRRRVSEEDVGEIVGTLPALEGQPSEPSTSNGQTSIQPVTASPTNSVVKPSTTPVMTKKFSEDDDLPAMIKVEPPDIRDIDEEPAGWESPKLVIDMMDDQEKVRSQQDRVTKRMVVNSVIVKRGRGRPRKLQGEEDEVMEPGISSFQATKGLLKVKSGLNLKKLLPGSPQWHRKRTGKIPRPPNAFMIFANEYRRKLAFDNPSENNKEISCRLGTMWKNLPPEVKETYYTQSREADEEHKRKYPGYYYSPKEARIRKNLKADLAVARRGPKPMDANYLVNVVMPDDSEDDPLPPPYLTFHGSPEALSPTPIQKKVIPLVKQKLIAPKPVADVDPTAIVTVKLEDDETESETLLTGNENKHATTQGNSVLGK